MKDDSSHKVVQGLTRIIRSYFLNKMSIKGHSELVQKFEAELELMLKSNFQQQYFCKL